jgi:hypothetical protein
MTLDKETERRIREAEERFGEYTQRVLDLCSRFEELPDGEERYTRGIAALEEIAGEEAWPNYVEMDNQR